MSRTRKIVLIVSGVLLGCLLLGVLMIALFISALRNSGPSIEDNSVLVLNIKGSMPDYVTEDPLAKALGAEDNSLTSLLWQIRKAKADKRIKALLLDIDFSSAGWGQADEIRDAIADFRTSGKPVYAYMLVGSNKEYYIAAAADRVYMSPSGNLFTFGLAAEAMFVRGSLDKLGIYPEVFKIGKYKNAPDMFTEKKMTDGQREVMNSMLDDIYGRLVNKIAEARKKSPDDVRAIIDNAPYTAPQAKENGLIDDVKYRDEVESELKKRLGYKEDEKLKLVKGSEYKEVKPESLNLNQGEKVAVIYASGTIGLGSSDDSPFGDQSVGSDTMVKALNVARDDKSIKAVVIRIDSPGGSVFASDEIWHAIENVKAKKPVVVSMGDVAASGGYYIACNANRIIAQPSTITGSIGIFAGKPVMKGFYDWLGISNEYVMRGKNAGMFRETEQFTDDERAKFQEIISRAYYDEFVPKVAKGRNKSVEEVDSLGQGRVWMGSQAKERGLVDEFGGLEHAISVAKQLANLPADKEVRRVILPYPRTFFEKLFNQESEDEAAKLKLQQQRAIFEALPEDMRRAFQYAAMLERMKKGDALAIMPYEIRIK
ncbi:MAG TPA: signal peptide peptidase SppA [Pyrinomonadaceae bacterium]|nr:signal peptide peptidase SppA [Pyrinomonadaceae bacterium]